MSVHGNLINNQSIYAKSKISERYSENIDLASALVLAAGGFAPAYRNPP